MAPAAAHAADGGVHLYLQPFPADAAKLTFTVASVSALAAGGAEVPLKVNLGTAAAAAVARQRLLASGRLPPGSYAGFVVRIGRAALRAERGEVALTVPDTPVRLDVPFVVGPPQAPLFWLVLNYQASVASGFAFTPAFAVVAPSRPIPDQAGLVTDSGADTITVFDKHLRQAVAAIDTCARPSGLALDQFRRRVYVACSKDDEIQSIDIATGDILERARLSPGDRPREVALTPDGQILVSVNTGSNSISFFDASSLTRRERVSVGDAPGSILIDPAGRRAFVFNTMASSVTVIDMATRSVAATLSLDSSPLRGQFSARGDRLYVIHERSPYLTVIDPRQLTMVTRARLRTSASAIAVDSVRNLLYIGSATDTGIDLYDPNALLPVNAMKTRASASYLTIDAAENTLYMVCPDTKSLVVGRLADRTLIAEIDVGEGPYWVSVAGEK